jgi:hypothetical protein
MVRKTTVASPRGSACARVVRDSLRCDPGAHPTSRALPTSPSPPPVAGKAKNISAKSQGYGI